VRTSNNLYYEQIIIELKNNNIYDVVSILLEIFRMSNEKY